MSVAMSLLVLAQVYIRGSPSSIIKTFYASITTAQHYPLIFPHSEKRWHSLIPLADINLVDNINLQAFCRTHINSESEDDNDMQDAPRHGRGGSKRVS